MKAITIFILIESILGTYLGIKGVLDNDVIMVVVGCMVLICAKIDFKNK